MPELTGDKYLHLFELRAKGELPPMQCTRHLLKLIKKIYHPGIKILDVGCTTGHYYRVLKHMSQIDYTGIDSNSKAIEKARYIWGKQASFYTQDARDILFQDNAFDVVICYNLLSHILEHEDVLKQLWRVSSKHIFIRALFNKVQKFTYTPKVYKTYSKQKIKSYINVLGHNTLKFIPDNHAVPINEIRNQAKILGVDESEFCHKNAFQGIPINYEVLHVIKN